MRYRRARVAGASYFFTVNVAARRSGLLVEYVDTLRAVVREVRSAHPFEIISMVVMPDHLHAVWELPAGDADFATRWTLIKAGFSRRLPRDERISASRRSKGERGVWQRRYWEHLIRGERDLASHVDYIHFNPVKHGYVEHAIDWPYSSIHRYVADGTLRADWADGSRTDAGACGERK
jgi:putative transposase